MGSDRKRGRTASSSAKSRSKKKPSARSKRRRRGARRHARAVDDAQTRVRLARRVLASARIALADVHPSGHEDGATARQNVADTAEGRPAARSRYENAPGGHVELSTDMLAGVLAVAERFAIAVSEIAGGSHSPRSRHYAGLAFDIHRIDGRPVDAAHPALAALRALLDDLGATEVRGPGDPGHDAHVHGAWPRA